MYAIRSGAAVVVTLALALAGCAEPEVTAIHEDDGITGVEYGASSLADLRLADGVHDAAFALAPVASGTDFDRTAIVWESFEAGGGTAFEVSADGGTWVPLVVDFAELVPETGATLFAGHADLPAGSRELAVRVRLFREPDAGSPELRALRVEVFERAAIAEEGVPFDPSVLEEGEGMAFGQPAIVTRAEWGARAPKCDGSTHTPYRMTFHETVTTNGESGNAAKARMRQMQAFHQDGRGWCDIGYHFSIDAAGKIYRGRTTTQRTGSHVGSQNSGNIGISLMGTYTTAQPPQAQLDGLMDAFAWLAETYGIDVNGDKIRGHREWPGQSTTCPGTTVFPKKTQILAGIAERLVAEVPPPPDPVAPVIIDNATTGFAASETWWLSTSQGDRWGADYEVRAAESTSDVAAWNAQLPESRDYEVFVWYSQGANRASAAPYFVHHTAGSTKVSVNQQVNGGRWVSLGTFSFAAGTQQRVTLSCWTGSGQYVIADAVKLEPR